MSLEGDSESEVLSYLQELLGLEALEPSEGYAEAPCSNQASPVNIEVKNSEFHFKQSDVAEGEGGPGRDTPRREAMPLPQVNTKPLMPEKPLAKKEEAIQAASSKPGCATPVSLKCEKTALTTAPKYKEKPTQTESELAAQQREKLQNLLNSGLSTSKKVQSPQSQPALPNPLTDENQEPSEFTTPKVLPSAAAQAFQSASAAPEEGISEKAGPLAMPEQALQSATNNRPPWEQEHFEALLLEVSGLTLAVPLVALGQIQSINQELTPIFGQAGWFMGLLKTPNANIRTVNTALFVMPEKYKDEFLQGAKYVVTLEDSHWGLAVDKVDQPISIDPKDVQWRGERSKRPWLAGTVKSAMCALVDVPNLLTLLNATDPT